MWRGGDCHHKSLELAHWGWTDDPAGGFAPGAEHTTHLCEHAQRPWTNQPFPMEHDTDGITSESQMLCDSKNISSVETHG